jgi:nucleotide-binding universal stress UspA family protein
LHYAERLKQVKAKAAQERVEQLLAKFRAKCQNDKVRYREAEHQGSPSERIISESNYYDAVVMGMRTHFRFEDESPDGETLEDLLDESVTPVYAVPAEYSFTKAPGESFKVLIAYDNSLPAARALQRFAQFVIPEVQEVLLLAADRDKVAAEFYLTQAAAYLQAHSITRVTKEYASGTIIEVVESKYLDWADMVVMGAHSKRGLFDFKLGSLTKFLIERAQKPLLIGQ